MVRQIVFEDEHFGFLTRFEQNEILLQLYTWH